MKRRHYIFTKRRNSDLAVMATLLGLISNGSLAAVLYLAYKKGGAIPVSYGLTGLLAAFFSAAGLIMAIVGGALLTPWMASIIGDVESVFCGFVGGFSTVWDDNLKLTQTTLRASFFVPVICFAVVGAYALAFMRGRKRN